MPVPGGADACWARGSEHRFLDRLRAVLAGSVLGPWDPASSVDL